MEEIKELIQSLAQKDIWDKISVIGGAVSVVLLFFTYRLAIQVNRKLKRPILEGQLKSVNKLLKSLQNQKISFYIYDKSVKDGLKTLIECTFFSILREKELLEYRFCPVFIQKDAYDNLRLFKFKNDVLIPKNISKSIDKLYFDDYKKRKPSKSDFQQVVVICIDDTIPIDKIYENEEFFYASNRNGWLFKDIYESFLELNKTIQEWLEKPNMELNLR